MSRGSSKVVRSVAATEVVKRMEEGCLSDEEMKSLMKLHIQRRLQWGYKSSFEDQISHNLNFVHYLRNLNTVEENVEQDEQLYEIPISFLKLILGKSLKQSPSYFKDESTTLDEAEIAMLDLCCERAQIIDGHSILDLGCGPGSFTLHVAQKYKNCHVTAVTNSRAQKDYIEEQCKTLELSNVEVVLADVAKLKMEATFDRIVVTTMFEHMNNYAQILKKISQWMTKGGLLFLEYLCHKVFAYPNEPIDEDDWYTGAAFPAGTFNMVSASFFLYFQDDVSVVNHWVVNGKHFARTLEEYLKNLDKNIDAAKELLESSTGSKEEAKKLVNFWRGFCIRERELHAYNNGEEWMLSQMLFKKK